MMQINPLQMLMSAMQQRINPMTYLQQQSQRVPAFGQLSRMIQGKSSQQLREMAEGMARERGTTLDAVAQQMGIKLR